MRKKNKTKPIGEVSVSKLLDDFVDLDVEDDSKRARQLDDDEYIRMMLEKEDKRKQERAKRTPLSSMHDEEQTSLNDDIEKPLPQQIEPESETFEPTCESDLSLEDETSIEEIMKSQDLMEEPALSGRMKAAVEFLQDEVGASESKRKARKTLEKYRKDQPVSKKEGTPVISEKISPVKTCQNCHFCVGERKVSGSCWCHCTNQGRSSHVVVKGSWVMSRLNLPCWKPPQE